MCHDWPKPPTWPKDLPLIRELLTDQEYAELLRRRYCRTAPAAGLPAGIWRSRTESPERRWENARGLCAAHCGEGLVASRAA